MLFRSDQYGVGDIVRIDNREGTVEEMTLRVTVLRSGDGELHVIPNGNIQMVTVLSRDWRRATVDVSVSRKADLGRVFEVLNQVGEQIAKDRPQMVMDKPAIAGIERMTGSGILIRSSVKTLPLKHGDIAHDWRRRIKEAFDKEGIEMAPDYWEEMRGK